MIAKQMFDILIDKTIAFNYPHHIGLIDFSTNACLVKPITHVIEDFRAAVQNVKAWGWTALWQALSMANEELLRYSQRHPGAKKRIVVLTDGEDSTHYREHVDMVEFRGPIVSAVGVGRDLMVLSQFLILILKESETIVDAFIIGGSENQDLRVISYL